MLVAHSRRTQEFSRSLVRVEFADGLVLEAAFAPLESLSALRSLVSACLEKSLSSSFYLFTAPAEQKVVRTCCVEPRLDGRV